VSNSTTILWFRQDLRLRDNAALQAALAVRGPIVPVYIWDDESDGRWKAGAASRWWLHHSLAALDAVLRKRGSRLILERGESLSVIEALLTKTKATSVYWNRCYEPNAVARDKRIKAELVAKGVEAKSFNSALLFEPHTIANKQGGAFQVFTPYWRHCLAQPVAEEIALPPRLVFPAPAVWPRSLELGDF